MLEKQKIDKLLELTNRAIAVNKNLLLQKQKLLQDLSEGKDVDDLKGSLDSINLAVRKEVLYNQVAQLVIQERVIIQ